MAVRLSSYEPNFAGPLISRLFNLLYYHFHIAAVQRTGSTVWTMHDDIGYVETLVAAQVAELFLLLSRERSSITCQRNGISHRIEEYSAETGNGKWNINQSVIDCRMDTRH